MRFFSNWRFYNDGPSLLKYIDFNFVAVLSLAPFVMGGRHPLGHLVVVLLALSTSLAWLLHHWRSNQTTWVSSPVEKLMIVAVGLLVLQLVPLPAAAYKLIPSQAAAFLPVAGDDAGAIGIGSWSQISFTPAATRGGLALLLAYGLLFVVAVQRLRDIADIERMFKWIAVSAIVMATFGIVQYLTSNGKFFWFYAYPFRDTSDVVKGAFINRNHFTHFLALGLPALIWWTAGGARKDAAAKRNAGFGAARGMPTFPIWLLLGLGVVCLAGLLSLSRGGIGSMVVATAVCLPLLHRAIPFKKQMIFSVMGLLTLLAFALAIHGSDGVLNRIDEVTSGSLDKLDRESGRRKIWWADLQAIRHFPLLGAGVGSHAAVYPMFLPRAADDPEYSHAESGYLHVALETGVAGLALVLLTMAICGRWCWRTFRLAESKRQRACLAVVCASLAVSALHSLVDFVWFIPACMSTTVLLAACAYRLWLLTGHPIIITQRSRVVQPSGLRWATAVVVVVGIWMLAEAIGPALGAPAWDRYQRASATAAKAERIALEDGQQAAESKAFDRRAGLEAMMTELETLVARDAHHAVGHVRLSAVKLRLFELVQQESPNPMPLAAIRDAAFQSGFKSRTQLDEWLGRAVGAHYRLLEHARYHARRALALCPLLGEAYVYLKELSFLEGADPAAKSSYLAQALRVRPFDGEIHFEAGKECFLDGKPAEAIAHWRTAYHSSEEYKIRLIDLFASELATQLPIGFFLEQFAPDLDGLRRLRMRYRKLNLPEERRALLNYSATTIAQQAKIKSGAEACNLWLEAESLFRDLGDPTQQVQCVREALSADANNYAARYAAVFCFYHAKQFDDAEPHVKWCLNRAPSDKDLKRIRDDIVRARLDSSRQASQPQATTKTVR